MRVSLEDARAIAEKLKQSPRVRGVELFGSVLREGVGHDVDLVILVDRDIARTWWTEMSEALRVRMATRHQWLRRNVIKPYLRLFEELFIRDRKHRRQARASELIGVDLQALAHAHKPKLVIDAFLLPEDWRTGDTLNGELLRGVIPLLTHRRTKMFLEHIAERAVRL